MKKRMALLGTAALCAVSIAVGVVAADVVRKIEAELRPDFTIVIDGQEVTFKNAQGEVVSPVLYNGTTYLPIRAIGELMGKTVYWYEDEKRIELREEKTTVTDADVIVTGNGNSQAGKNTQTGKDTQVDKAATNDSFIGEEKAKELALEKAGLAAGDVTFARVELDKDDRVWQYEIEFRQNRTEYDVDVDAVTGKILSFEKDFDD